MKFTAQRFKADGHTADATIHFILADAAQRDAARQALVALYPAAQAALDSGDIDGSRDKSTLLYTGSKKSPRAIVIGLGESGKVDAERLRRAAALAAQRSKSLPSSRIAFVLPELDMDSAEVAEAIVVGAGLGAYSYDRYFTERPAPKKILSEVLLLVADEGSLKSVQTATRAGSAIVNGVTFARDLANAPSNDLDPAALAQEARSLSSLGVQVKVLDKAQITKLGMGGLLAVNLGSVRPPHFIIMEWNGGKAKTAPVVLVGKGITFDSGGISIKPGAGMGDMKMDMGGAAAVLGTMRAIAELKLPLNVIGLVPTTENMPSGSAYKPGDVIRFMNGKTAEIDNTDAEGRLILADALTYASRYKPQAVIDLATLTGAIVIALGNTASGLFSNNRALAQSLANAGNQTYDRVWELPLHEEYEELIKSDIADVKNSGGRGAGSITAALFLQHFIGEYPWAHIDIAGTGMTAAASGYINRGGTGAGVRLLVQLLRQWKGLS